MSTSGAPTVVQPVEVVVITGAAGAGAGLGLLAIGVGAALGEAVLAGAAGGASLVTEGGVADSVSLALERIERVTATAVMMTPAAAATITTVKIIFFISGVICTGLRLDQQRVGVNSCTWYLGWLHLAKT